MLFFGMGLISWFSVEAAILGRLRTEPALDPAVRGIIGVQLAPPFVGGNAYLAANGGHVDWVSWRSRVTGCFSCCSCFA